MLFGKRGKSGLVALKLDLAQVAAFVKERLGKEVLDTNFSQIHTLKYEIYNLDDGSTCIQFFF